MKNIGLVVGESADLPEEIIKREKMVLVPFNKIDFPEGDPIWEPLISIDKRKFKENFYKIMRKAKTAPKTSQPSVKDFILVYKKALQKFTQILVITLTSRLSGTYNSAIQARKFLKEKAARIHIIDSLHVSVSEALLALKAVELIKKNGSIKKIKKELTKFIPKIKLIAFLDTLKQVEMGGRISGIKLKIANALIKRGIRPLLGIKDGTVDIMGMRPFSTDIPTALFREIKKRIDEKKIKVAICHSDNLKGAKRLKEMLEEKLEVIVAFVSELTPILGCHAGPGALGLAFHEL